MSFYVDADDQRAKARRAEQRLLEHARVRPQRRAQWEPEQQEASSLPPVFRVEGHYLGGRETSIERRNSRFRDTHLYGPPPPPPIPADAVPRMLPPTRFLVPQYLADQGLVNDPRYAVNDPQAYDLQAPNGHPPQPGSNGHAPQASPSRSGLDFDPLQRVEQWLPSDPEENRPRYRSTPNGFASLPVPPPGLRSAEDYERTQAIQAGEALLWSYATVPGIPQEVQAQMRLTASQKKRLRRKRAKQGSPNGQSRSAPYPLPQDTLPQISAPPQSQNGRAPHADAPTSPPEPDPSITQTECEAIVRAIMPNGIQVGLRCPLQPFPHPNQPHMIQLASAPGYEGTSIFIGWWQEGE